MKILVTGGDGFLGAPIVRALLAQGHHVAALVLPHAPLRRLGGLPVDVLEAGLEDGDRLRNVLNDWRPDACIHLAWYAEPGKYLTSPHNIALLHASFDLMQLLAESGCRHIVTAGTCAEYDAERGWLKEDGPTKPQSLYAATKLSLCVTGEQLARSLGMTFAHARVFYPYGPAEDPRRMVPALIRALLAGKTFEASGGEQVRDYIHIDDIANAFVTLLTQNASGIYNIGSGEPLTVRRLMETIEGVVGRRGLIQFGALPPREWEPRFLCADMQKLRGLGYAPQHTLVSGLEQTAAWWREQGVEQEAAR